MKKILNDQGEVVHAYSEVFINVPIPANLNGHSRELIRKFAEKMAAKMYRSQLKYGYQVEWQDDKFGKTDSIQEELELHLVKGDPVDVAIYCAFLDHHNRAVGLQWDDWSNMIVPREKTLLYVEAESKTKYAGNNVGRP